MAVAEIEFRRVIVQVLFRNMVIYAGRALPQRFQAEIARALDRIALVARPIAELEAERNALVQAPSGPCLPAAHLLALCGIGPESAAVLSLECFFRHFDNRRQLAAYAGLAPSPWQSGRVERIQEISKAGNGRLRTAMVELAWLRLRYQPNSVLAAWFRQRGRAERGRPRRIAIVALARKLLVAPWRDSAPSTAKMTRSRSAALAGASRAKGVSTAGPRIIVTGMSATSAKLTLSAPGRPAPRSVGALVPPRTTSTDAAFGSAKVMVSTTAPAADCGGVRPSPDTIRMVGQPPEPKRMISILCERAARAAATAAAGLRDGGTGQNPAAEHGGQQPG